MKKTAAFVNQTFGSSFFVSVTALAAFAALTAAAALTPAAGAAFFALSDKIDDIQHDYNGDYSYYNKGHIVF